MSIVKGLTAVGVRVGKLGVCWRKNEKLRTFLSRHCVKVFGPHGYAQWGPIVLEW